MKRRHVILGTTAVGSFLLGTAICLVLRPGPNLLRNPDFEWGLKHWSCYVDTKAGTQATFTADPRGEQEGLPRGFPSPNRPIMTVSNFGRGIWQ